MLVPWTVLVWRVNTRLTKITKKMDKNNRKLKILYKIKCIKKANTSAIWHHTLHIPPIYGYYSTHKILFKFDMQLWPWLEWRSRSSDWQWLYRPLVQLSSVTVPSLTMMTSTIFAELLARDRHTDRHTPHTHTHRVIYVNILDVTSSSSIINQPCLTVRLSATYILANK